MNKNTKIVIGVVIATLIIWGGSLAIKNSKAPTSTEPIKIGFIGPLTGNAVSYGEPIRNAIALGVRDINAAGGVDGRKIEVIYEDAKCSGKDAASAVQKLMNVDKVNIIFGGVCTGEVLAVTHITEPGKVLLMPFASGSDITHAGEFIFRNSPPAAEGNVAIARTIMKDYRTVAIISENTDYAQGGKKVFIESLKAFGGEIVADENFAPGTTDFRSTLTKINALNPDVIFVNPQTEVAGATIINQARGLGMKTPLYGTVILAGSHAIELAGANAEDMIIYDAPGLSEENPKAVKFLLDYEAEYGEISFIPFYLGAGYDAPHILAQAISKVGTDTEKLKDYLYNMKSFNGVIGTYGFDENGDIDGIGSVIKVIQNGKAVEVK